MRSKFRRKVEGLEEPGRIQAETSSRYLAIRDWSSGERPRLETEMQVSAAQKWWLMPGRMCSEKAFGRPWGKTSIYGWKEETEAAHRTKKGGA